MTIFSVQRFLEDHIERRGLTDVDDYAIKAANTYERLGPNASNATIAGALGRIRTVFFRRNVSLNRRDFEAGLAATLRRRFQKKKVVELVQYKFFQQSLQPARTRLRSRRRSIGSLVAEFKKAVEARAIDAFWVSRKNNRLRARPEKIAQALLAVFAKAVVANKGMVIRELASGVGFVDVGVAFGGVMHLIELKILKGPMTGAGQLSAYMKTEGRPTGWLLLIDARKVLKRTATPSRIKAGNRTIRILRVDVNPPPPNTLADPIS